MQRLGSIKGLGTSVKKIVTQTPPALDPFEAYQLWADTYDNTGDNALLFAEFSAVRPLIGSSLRNGKSILDAGCGTGRYSDLLQRSQPRTHVAIDFAPKMIEKLRSKILPESSIFPEIARLEQLPLKDETFDFVLCTLVLGHVVELNRAVAELSRVLLSGGTMIISCFHPYGTLLGWDRSFRVHNSSKRNSWISAKYYRHLHSDYFSAFQTAHLKVVKMLEPVIGEPIKPFYDRAGRLHLYERFKGYPLLLVFQILKQ